MATRMRIRAMMSHAYYRHSTPNEDRPLQTGSEDVIAERYMTHRRSGERDFGRPRSRRNPLATGTVARVWRTAHASSSERDHAR